jgi:ferredoxin
MGDAGNLKITVDRENCIGDGLCCDDAPETFELDDEQKAIVKTPPGDTREAVIEAASNCPVDAIKVEDAKTGKVLYPEQ